MSKTKVPELKQPLWQDIIYLAFVALAPIIITAIELFQSTSSVFKWSFASLGSILITVLVLRRFVLHGIVKKWKDEIHSIEHDYSLGVGNAEYAEIKWKKYKLYCYLYDAIVVILFAILIWFFLTALAEGLIAFRGAATLILIFVVVGTMFKAFTYISVGKDEVETDEGETT